MARYVGPVCRMCRREGMKLFLKGERCYTEKVAPLRSATCRLDSTVRDARLGWPATVCSFARSRRSSVCTVCWRISSGGTSKRLIGSEASRARRCCSCSSGASTASSYRLGLATSRPQARQLVRHGHFLINGRRMDIPSYSVRAGDVVSVVATSTKNLAIQHAMEEVKGRGIPEWLEFNTEKMAGRIASLPTRAQINLPVQEQLIVELYSK